MSSEEDSDEKIREHMKFSKEVLFPLLERIKNKYVGKTFNGHITCPKCKVKGALKVSQVIHRGQGRLRVSCLTENCISLME